MSSIIFKTNNGLLSAFDARTGKPHYQVQRLEKAANVFASPVGAAGRVYIPGRDGTTVVLRHGPTFEVLAENTLDDGFDASPALVDRELYLRGYRYLYAIGQEEEELRQNKELKESDEPFVAVPRAVQFFVLSSCPKIAP